VNVRYLVLAAGLAAVFWAYRRWREGLVVALVMVVLEGAIRKWLVPGAQDLIYFAKDVLLLGVYAGYLTERQRTGQAQPMPSALVPLILFGLLLGALQIFNPSLPNPLVGVLGFKAYFFYIPLLWVVPAAFRDDRELARFLSRYIWLAVPIGLLATAQFLSPAGSALNTYARESSAGAISTFGSSTQVRVTGTFSYITGYSSYLLAIVILVLAVLATTRWRLRGNLGHYAALGLSLLGMLMTGSRGPVFLLVLLLPLYAWLAIAREEGGGGTLGRILLGAALLAMLLNVVGAEAIHAFYGRARTASDVGSRFLGPFVHPFQVMDEVGALGLGIGSTHQTAEAVTRGTLPYSWLRGLLAEDEPTRVMIELGPFGFLLTYLLRLFLIFLALGQVFRLRTRFHRAVATSCLLFFLPHLPGGVVFNVTSGVYYWFFAGLLLWTLRRDAELGRSPARP
jgi:hypothetical protein